MLGAFVFTTTSIVKADALTHQQNEEETLDTTTQKEEISSKDTVNYIPLQPTKEKVTYVENTYSTSINYPSIKSQESLFSGMSISLTNDDKVYLKNYIQKYFRANGTNFQKIHAKSNHYFSTITKIFTKYGIPENLKYLAVIESNLNTHARSYVGAVGTWQFMASTARLLGLTVNAHRDDRNNLYKSTVAAAKYLSELHQMFDNWILVVAAYNSGPARVKQAISSSKSDRFWELKKYLPQESQNHVMKFLATTYIMNRFANFFGVDPTKDLFHFNLNHQKTYQSNTNLASISLSGKYSPAVIAQYTSMDLKTLQQLNPKIIEHLTDSSNDNYVLYLPVDKMITFKSHQSEILNKSIELFKAEE